MTDKKATLTQEEAVIEPMSETDPAALPAVVEHQAPGVTFSAQQVELLKETVCNPGIDKQGRQLYATDAELDLFLAVCRRTGLDPFARQIYAVFRWNPNLGRKAMQVQTSIDGFRVIAERSSTYAGQAGPLWCGADGAWTDVWLSSDYPAAAKVGVLRRGFAEPMWAVAKWAEFVQTDNDGKVGKMWKALPTIMLAKCAEAQALRRAFPNDLSGLYTAEEMAQADNPTRSTEAPPAAPPPGAHALDEVFTPTAVAQVRKGCLDAGFTEDDIADMVEMGTNGRVSTLEEVTYGERPALAKAKAHIVARKAQPLDDADAQAHYVESMTDPDDREAEDAWWLSIAPKVRALVDKADKTKPTAAQYRALVTGLKALGVEEDDDQRHKISLLLGYTVRSRKTLSASELSAVVSVLDEEGAG